MLHIYFAFRHLYRSKSKRNSGLTICVSNLTFASYSAHQNNIYYYKTFWNFISTVIGHDYRHYIGKIWNESENKYRIWKIFIAKMTKVFGHSIIHYINKPQCVVMRGPLVSIECLKLIFMPCINILLWATVYKRQSCNSNIHFLIGFKFYYYNNDHRVSLQC